MKTNFFQELSMHLRQIMRDRGMSGTQHDLAKKLVIDRSAVSHVETGRSTLSRDYQHRYLAFAEELGVFQEETMSSTKAAAGKTWLTADQFNKTMQVHSRKVVRKNVGETEKKLTKFGGIVIERHADPKLAHLSKVLVIVPENPTPHQKEHTVPFLASLTHVLHGGPMPTPYRPKKKAPSGQAQLNFPDQPAPVATSSGGNGAAKPTPKEEPAPKRRHHPREMKEMRKLHYATHEEREEAKISALWAIRSTLGQLVKLAAKDLGVKVPEPDPIPEQESGQPTY